MITIEYYNSVSESWQTESGGYNPNLTQFRAKSSIEQEYYQWCITTSDCQTLTKSDTTSPIAIDYNSACQWVYEAQSELYSTPYIQTAPDDPDGVPAQYLGNVTCFRYTPYQIDNIIKEPIPVLTTTTAPTSVPSVIVNPTLTPTQNTSTSPSIETQSNLDTTAPTESQRSIEEEELSSQITQAEEVSISTDSTESIELDERAEESITSIEETSLLAEDTSVLAYTIPLLTIGICLVFVVAVLSDKLSKRL